MLANRQDLSPTDATLAILAGGEGSRMGRPKAELVINSRPILEYLLDEIGWLGPTLLVTAPGREHPPGWKRFSHEVSDPVFGDGPLRGILTALEQVKTPLLLLLTVDMPGIRQAQCQALLDCLRHDPSLFGAMVRRGEDGVGASLRSKIEPFPLAIRTTARPVIAERLSLNQRSIHSLLGEAGFVAIAAPTHWDESVWTNLNTPTDLDEFEKRSACDEFMNSGEQ